MLIHGRRSTSTKPPVVPQPPLSTPFEANQQQQPPPPPPKKGGGFFKFLGLTTLAAGGVVGYAWYDSNFRKQIEDNVPYSKDAFDALFQLIPTSETIKSTDRSGPLIPNISPKPEEESKMRRKVPQTQSDIPPMPAPPMTAPPPAAPTPVAAPVKSEKERKKEEAQRKLKQKEAEEAAENAALEVYIENMTDMCNKTIKQALEKQTEVISTTKQHIEALKKAMDDASEILNKDSQWQEVSSAYGARLDAVTSSDRLVTQAREQLQKLKNAITEGKSQAMTKKNKILISAQETFNKLNSELNKQDTQVKKVESQSKMMLKYKDLVEQGKKQFQKELESIMPEVKLGQARGKKLTEEELNSLIAHAHRRIEQLQKQLAEQIALEQQRIQQALEQQIQEDDRLSDQRVANEQQRLKNEFLIQKEKWESDSRVVFEQELRQHLARQAAAHSDHLKDVLKIQEKELEQVFERELNTKLIEERQSFHTEVANWIARLRGIESAVEGRAESERVSRKAQQLWLACVALNKALMHGIEDIDVWELKIKPLANEIAAVSDAAGNHPYVKSNCEKYPEVSYKRGVWTDDSLIERFNKVHRVCRRVAMIDETGGGLGKYFLSYIQSFFIFESVYARVTSDEVELDKLSTYQILANAKYWMDRDDLEMAVRYMNQLQGEARRVAEEWIKESKLHLETRQATQALMAFASASGLGTIF
ncbi:FCJ1 [Mytilus edulis]|uniref:MICOS complex subunit MIC60 n=1 Tax=Mytilus edulis TaxID=6550 RepID=A0A8S3TUH2_MYTED|nr:FCJ1 [Mytilus edulis]